MGIPKFFRYISERYPLTSQLIHDDKIPEFDNLYLDFNGIIHNCSHPNDEDAHFRLSEEQIFTSIFAYVDHLFGKIKPRKLFFMAVDGVAPRAKMNQQRSRRFRTAKEAKEIREKAEKALKKGEKMPDEKAFDSNCITPGTPFMVRLSHQLRYFINKKITEDSNWRDVQVVLSGHEVPGEGEHKIMEYIRLSRAQPDYNPNIRHCLYGLDADLIMLGLASHDPHFCLLREEVKFGPASRKKGGTSLESINFYLLHLSLMREYLDLEFQDIEPTLLFVYNLERVIDDFILLAVFVGNDFLPNLPDLHIHENGLERLFEVYKKVLPSLDGYINENGTISLKRLQVVLNEMVEWERGIFETTYSDISWYKGKQRKHNKDAGRMQNKSSLDLTSAQREIFERVRDFVLSGRGGFKDRTKLAMPNNYAAADRAFITRLAQDLHLDVTWDEYDEDINLVTWRLPGSDEVEPEAQGGGLESGGGDDEWEDVDADEAESRIAVDRVLKKYEKANIVDLKEDEFDDREEARAQAKMDEWKRDYYRDKLGISFHDPKEMGDLIYRYVEGLQWVMHYYYSGVASWSWFYNYHYAPRISDLRGVDLLSFNFELGKPFRPFEQLMGVLPVASKEHIPVAYQDLMFSPTSPILHFYPLDFEQDLNGKKQDWETIVKIPFIEEIQLLAAMKTREHHLTPEEVQRNQFGTSTKFSYSTGEPTVYPSSLPGFFPTLQRCTCIMEPFYLPLLDGLHLIDGLCDGVFLGAEALAGFPSLKTLPHYPTLGPHGVNVHGTESRNKSMIVNIENPYEETKVADIAERMIGERTYIGWPFLQEALVVAVSDSLFKYEKIALIPSAPKKVVSNPHGSHGLSHWKSKAERIHYNYSKRCGVLTGEIDVLLHVRPLKGLKRLESGAFVKDYEGPDKETEHAVQMCLSEVSSEDPRFLEKGAPPISEEFPEGSKIFFLGEHAYGVAAQVSATTETTLSVLLAFFPSDKAENDKFKAIVGNRQSKRYYPSFKAAEELGISGRALSKVTSSFMVITDDNQKTNLGLSLKFEAKALKVVDYSRKDGRHWEFSEEAIELIREYKAKFPEIFRVLDMNGDAMARASEVFTGPTSDARLKDIKAWLKAKGVRDFEPVSLFCDQLTKDTVTEIEKLAESMTAAKSSSTIRKAIVKGIPRQAVLKPAHAVYRLQNQQFALGDRVTMVQDSGGVPLAAKGVVIGLNSKSMDVVWDVPFMSGVTMGDRCSMYRGSTVDFNTCLNLTNPQFITSTNPKAPPPVGPTVPFQPRFGPHPAIRPAIGQVPAGGFRPGNTSQQPPHVHIMANPNRGARGGTYVNGRGAPVRQHFPLRTNSEVASSSSNAEPQPQQQQQQHFSQPNGVNQHNNFASPRGHPRGGRGFGSSRGFAPKTDRGRGVGPRGGGGRARGRGSTEPLPL